MRIIKSTFGYIIASLCVFIALSTFVANHKLRRILIEKTGLTVSPWITGGVVDRSIDHGTYRTDIHSIVSKGLIWERDEGFIQIDWLSESGLPEAFVETLDYNGDGKTDVTLAYRRDIDRINLETDHPNVRLDYDRFRRDNGLSVRIKIKCPCR